MWFSWGPNNLIIYSLKNDSKIYLEIPYIRRNQDILKKKKLKYLSYKISSLCINI